MQKYGWLIALSLCGVSAAACGNDNGSGNPAQAGGMGGSALPIGGSPTMGTPPAGGSGPTVPTMSPPPAGSMAPKPAGMGGAMMPPAPVPDAGAMPPEDGGAAPSAEGRLPPVDSVEMDGPYKVTIDMMAGANSWVFRPTELGKDGVKHPIFVWGTGATSVPMQYTDHFTRVASHGIVVISPNNSMVNAAAMKASLDWIIAENDKPDSVFYQKLNTKKIAMGGHSLGSIATFDQEATEMRLTTTIHIAGGSFDAMGSSKVKTPTAYMCGQMDLDLASPNCATDFENVKSEPTYFVQLDGVDHVSAARAALPGMVAWLRWWLNDETERKSMFVGPDCDFCKGIWANAKTKNF